MKLFLAVLGRGICQVFQSIGKLFGYKDGSSYGKVIWRIAATCLTTPPALLTICILYAFFKEVVMPKMISPEKYYNWENKYISNHVAFREDCRKDKRRILDKATDEVTLEADISCPDYIFHNACCIVQDSADGKGKRTE